MSSLILKLTPIALIDATSIVPLAIVPLFFFLGQRRPLLRAFAFILGIFLSYYLVGVLLLFGLDGVFKALQDWLHRLWTQPNTPELYLQILIGTVMIFFGYRLEYSRSKKGKDVKRRDMSIPQVFWFAAGINLAGIAGAIPYFAAVDQILREDLRVAGNLWVLAYYNLLFITPFIVLILIWVFFRERAQALFERLNQIMAKWLRRILRVVLLLLGLVLVIDGVGWLLGHPLIPV